MYYLLVRIWTVFAFGLSVVLAYAIFSQIDQLAELSLFLGCGSGIALWLMGIVLLAALFHPKRQREVFELPELNPHK
jgi:hypothetical protein